MKQFSAKGNKGILSTEMTSFNSRKAFPVTDRNLQSRHCPLPLAWKAYTETDCWGRVQ